MRRKVVVLAVAFMCVFSGVLARAQNTIEERKYRSPDGSYELTVTPTHSLGVGVGHNTLRHGGEVVYERDLPQTLWDARVLNSGRVFGYAFEQTSAGGYREAAPSEGKQKMQRIFTYLIDSEGKVSATAETPRGTPGYGGTPVAAALPVPRAIAIDEAQGRAMIWLVVSQVGEVEQVVYSLKDLTQIRTTRVKLAAHEPGSVFLLGARVIPDTPLILCEWQSDRDHSRNEVISVHDSEGRLVAEREVRNCFEDESTSYKAIKERSVEGLGVIQLIPRGYRTGKEPNRREVTFEVKDGVWGAKEDLKVDAPSEQPATEKPVEKR